MSTLKEIWNNRGDVTEVKIKHKEHPSSDWHMLCGIAPSGDGYGYSSFGNAVRFPAVYLYEVVTDKPKPVRLQVWRSKSHGGLYAIQGTKEALNILVNHENYERMPKLDALVNEDEK